MSDELLQRYFSAGLSVEESRELSRQAFFTPPETKEDLHAWIKLYLGLDFPDGRVDPKSTCSPMEMIWETYNKSRLGDDEEFTKVLYYSSRDSYKTLGASVLEVLIMVLLQKNVAHMAAIKDQSLKAQEYVKKFFNRPILRDYVTRKSERRVEFTRPRFDPYSDGTVDISKSDPEGEPNYIQILICTIQGVNFDHVPFMVIDEVDVVAHPEAYEEAKFIPSSFKGKLPITLLTSTRKFSFGLVQKEIDDQEKTGIKIRHWNILDVTEKCPARRHAPEEKKITIFRSDETLQAISQFDFENLRDEDKSKYVKDEGYAGCMKNCTIFASCQGRLATKQTSESNLLKPIGYVQAKFREVSPDKAKAQLLCWKPSAEGLIYKTIENSAHLRSPAEIAEMIDTIGRPKNFSRAALINFIRDQIRDGNLKPFGGIDWGHTHNFVFVFGVKDLQNRMFIVDCHSEAELLLDPAMKVTRNMIEKYCDVKTCMIYADSAYPMHIKTFRKGDDKGGFRIKGAIKGPGSVEGGIEVVRTQLMNANGETSLFFLEGDPGVDLLYKHMGQYHWKLDAAGKPTKFPDEENDDEPDAIRYLLMEVFGKGKGVIAASYSEKEKQMIKQRQGYLPDAGNNIKTYDNWLSKTIQDKIQKAGGTSKDAKGRSGTVIWDLGVDDDIPEEL